MARIDLSFHKMATKNSKFWVENPCILFNDMVFFPNQGMTKEEKLNALTRLAIAISIIMYFMKYEHWFAFLTISILLIIILNYAGSPEKFSLGELADKKDAEGENEESQIENFSVVPTYVGTDFQQTVIAPTFAEEWQIPPPAYDIYTQVPYPGESQDTFEMPLKPQSYPYGQYMTRTNLLPSDEYFTHLGCGGARTAREYVNSTYLRHDLARRENMMRIYKKRLNRRYRSNCNDSFSPYHSF